MERTKLHETENIGMSLKGKRIVILAARPDWIFGFSPPQILRVKNAVEVLAHHWICGHALRLGRGATFEDPTGVGLNQTLPGSVVTALIVLPAITFVSFWFLRIIY